MPTRSKKATSSPAVKKTAAAPRTTRSTRASTAPKAATTRTSSARSTTRTSSARSTTRKIGEAAKTAGAKVKKHVGDVLGLGRARVPEHVPRATSDRGGGRPKGIELTGRTRTGMTPKPARVKM